MDGTSLKGPALFFVIFKVFMSVKNLFGFVLAPGAILYSYLRLLLQKKLSIQNAVVLFSCLDRGFLFHEIIVSFLLNLSVFLMSFVITGGSSAPLTLHNFIGTIVLSSSRRFFLKSVFYQH